MFHAVQIDGRYHVQLEELISANVEEGEIMEGLIAMRGIIRDRGNRHRGNGGYRDMLDRYRSNFLSGVPHRP